MRDLFLVRHGQSEHHIKGFTGGWTKSHLTELGRQQAALTGQRLQYLIENKTVQFYSSDLDRAVETATIIGEILKITPQLESDLREMSWGIAVDMPLEEAKELELEKTEPLIDWVPFPQAETRRILYHRISGFLEKIKGQEDIYLIVSHGNTIATAIFWWLELPLSAQSTICFDIDLCSITHLRINDWDQKTISKLNSIDHLHSLLTEM